MATSVWFLPFAPIHHHSIKTTTIDKEEDLVPTLYRQLVTPSYRGKQQQQQQETLRKGFTPIMIRLTMLFSWWSLSSSSSSSPWQQDQGQRQLDNHRHIVDDDKDNDNDDDGVGDDSYWMYQHHDYNQTFITSTVTIRVTPRQDFLVSWACLSLLLLVSIGVATWQVYKERNIDQRSIVSSSSPPTNMMIMTTTTTITSDGTSSGSSALTGGGHHHHHHHNTNNKHRLVESSSSTAEVTRCVFRRLLLFAMLSRFICIPVMIWSDPIWCQFVGDTLPEMIFATAWTLLVTFFVQVVGIATGQGTNTTPSIVIQLTAYIVYLGLILLELVNSVASVLLYALLCCIYAALLGTIAYFLPRLLSLLTPIVHEPLLAWRLILCTVICTMLFCAHMIGFARIVLDPPQKVYWWWKYGCLEVVPAVLFLILLRPSVHHKDRVSSNNTGVGSGGGNFATDGSGGGGGGAWKRAPVPAGLIRTDSIESNHSNSPHHNNHQQHKQQQLHGVPVVVAATAKPHYLESTALSKSPPQQQQQQQHVSYGATNV